MRNLAATFAAVGALVLVPAAGAKEAHPGDLRLCDARRCVALTNRPLLNGLSSVIYASGSPAVAARPALGVQYLVLRFRNGYVTGIVATARLDRWLSYGVHLERFRRGTWYRMPPAVSLALRRLAAQLRPLRLTRAALAKSR